MRRWSLRLAAWFCVVLLGVLSLLPGDAMFRTGWDGHLEHVVAYFGAMLVITFAYGVGSGLGRRTALLIMYAGALEIGQNFSPGRHPALDDFAASSLGAILGGLVGLFVCAWYVGWREARNAGATP